MDLEGIHRSLFMIDIQNSDLKKLKLNFPKMRWDNIDITSNLIWTNILSLLKNNFLVSEIFKIKSIW